ncbi:hypothetical protein XENOCAPTIV_010142 [Xenoophorus captivus]|uniref:Uncharacterized protein n=1 Tax=Xenoophorus captivus TaxID=1517983 RepID=A0ABV0Q957_9TELE
MFSEGRDLAPQEDKMFRRRLKEETKQISATEKSIFSELELFESKSLQQVASSNLQQSKLSSRLEDLRMMMKNMQDSAVKESLALSAHPEPREQVRSGSLQLSRTAVDLHEEPAVSAVRSVEQRQHHLCCHVSRQMLQLCFFTFSNDPNPAGSLCSRIQAQKTSREEEKLQVSKKQLHLLALTGFTEGFVVHLGVLSSGF